MPSPRLAGYETSGVSSNKMYTSKLIDKCVIARIWFQNNDYSMCTCIPVKGLHSLVPRGVCERD